VAAFTGGKDEVLWNAKPRFGKTLTTYDLMRTLDVRKVLIVTNRPGDRELVVRRLHPLHRPPDDLPFVSDSPSLANRSPMTREQWRAYSNNHLDEDPRIVEFLSLQDLKGSQYFGGSYDKLRHIAQFDWDLLVIDEAHEGIDTTKTDVAFDQIKRRWTLHLSGTPFKALAAGKFGEDQIFNWTYEDEQTAREQWATRVARRTHTLALPTLNLLTYQISRMITDRLAEGVAIDEDEANIDYTFDLNEFFATKDNGFFEHEAEVIKFLDCMATNEKYPFSTPELRDEIRHSFWLLNRVASAKALERLLKRHEVFKDYTIVLAAGDGRSGRRRPDSVAVGKSLDKVRTAIAEAEQVGRQDHHAVGGPADHGCHGARVDRGHHAVRPVLPGPVHAGGVPVPEPLHLRACRACVPEAERLHLRLRPRAHADDLRRLRQQPAPNPSGDPGVRQDNIRRCSTSSPSWVRTPRAG
jgi:type II restriction enzyme